VSEPRSKQRGFTLLETMLSLVILAFVLSAVVEVQGTTMAHSSRVYNVTTATQLLHGAVLDIEEIYRIDGFPTGQPESLEETCELPDGFDRFECEYDILGLDMEGDLAQEMGGEMSENVNNSDLMQGLCSGGMEGMGAVTDPLGALTQMGLDTSSIGALVSLFDPDMMALCGVNHQRMCMNIRMIADFIPEIIKQAAMSTRKIRVRISWDEPGIGQKVLEAETFLTSTARGEEESKGLGL
jgi:prepilin-type N-terminal cleavage/methylation domain-containing protein